MRVCCPESRGCNAVEDDACALGLFAASAEIEESAVALSRWSTFQKACGHRRNDSERRFRRRAYERARDAALIALAFRQTTRDDVAIRDRRRADEDTLSEGLTSLSGGAHD
jgi:hypothetical protein